MLLIGSSAIKHWFPDFPREPKDLDYVGKGKNSREVEYLENPILDRLYQNDNNAIVNPNHLYTLKMSHMFWNINWEKHLLDIRFLQSKGCVLDRELFYELYEYWNEYHGKNKRSDLKMTAEDFFDNAVECEYEHDYLHTILNPIPTYTKILIGEVEVDEQKFNLLSHEEKCNLVTEEIMVMAWERWKTINYKIAYGYMLKKFIISHAPLWEAIFIIENHKELYKPKFNYFKTIEDGIKLINSK